MDAFVCVCVSVLAVYRSVPSPCVWVRMDYKGIRISREKRKQTDYTAALVQPKALCCSPENSLQRWSTYQEDPAFGEKSFILGFLVKIEKMFHPFSLAEMLEWAGICYLPTSPRHNYILKLRRLCWERRAGNDPNCLGLRDLKWALNLPCRRFQKSQGDMKYKKESS